MARNLRDMVIAITGASAGIGLEAARMLAGSGARLSLCARRLERLEEISREMGVPTLVTRADVGVPEDCRAFIERTIREFGRIDTLICNAGYGVYKPVEETSAEEVQQMMQVDVVGTTECIRHCIPHMKGNPITNGWRGQIMVISSAAARRGTPFIGVYSGAKAAQLALSEALRVELRDFRIAVTTVHPTPTKTEFRQVAERLGTYKLPPSSNFIKTQTAEEVARAMVKGIVRPVPEVWPWRSAGWGLSAGTLVPRLMDRLMYRYYDGVLRFNGKR